jgi:hypothetical protein
VHPVVLGRALRGALGGALGAVLPLVAGPAPPASAAPSPPVPVAVRVAAQEPDRPGGVPPLAAPTAGSPLRGFDVTSGPYGPGHRGVDLAAGTGQPVLAPAPGLVRFAGRVDRSGWVSLEVAPDVVVSLGPLRPIAVRPGQALGRGAVLGRLGPGHGGLHVGLRVAGTYVDPLPHLVRFGPPRLVPLPERRDRAGGGARRLPVAAQARMAGAGPAPGVPAGEVAGARPPGRGGRVGRGGAPPARTGGRRSRALVRAFGGPVRVLAAQVRALHARLAVVGGAALAAGVLPAGVLGGLRAACGTQPLRARSRPPNANVVVGVAGLGSSSATARALDLPGLGFARDDVVYFSYRGLPAPGEPGLGSAYGPADTYRSLRAAAHRLYDQLTAVRAARPGRRVDLVAHSQGGLVAAYFLAYLYDPRDRLLPEVDHLVTLATPHQGADLATTATRLGGTVRGRLLLDRLAPLARLLGVDVPADSPAVRQLSEDSRLVTQLRARALRRATALRGGLDVVVTGRHGTRPGMPGRVTCASHGGVLRDGRVRAAVVATLADQPLPPPAPGDDRLPRLLGDALDRAGDQLRAVVERWASVPARRAR